MIFDTPLPLVRISRNLSVLFVRKIEQFLNPPSPLRADVLYVWPLSGLSAVSIQDTLYALYTILHHGAPPKYYKYYHIVLNFILSATFPSKLC